MMPSTSNAFQIKVTPVFKICLSKLTSFLSRKFNASVADRAKQDIKARIIKQLSQNPFSAAKSERLTELGIMDYRQLQVSEHNIVFYRVDEKLNTVVLLLVMDSRQDLKKLLFEVNLLS